MLRVINGNDAARMEEARRDAERGERAWMMVELVQAAEAASLEELRYLVLSARAVAASRMAG